MNRRVLAALVALGLSQALPGFAGPIITEKEAALPVAKGELKTRGISRGPGIKVVSPDPSAAVRGAFDIQVNFEPRGGNKIDPNSVRIMYLRSPAVDLTPRLKNGITETGILYSKAEVPQGEHTLRIVVKDIEGRESSSTMTINAQK